MGDYSVKSGCADNGFLLNADQDQFSKVWLSPGKLQERGLPGFSFAMSLSVSEASGCSTGVDCAQAPWMRK